MGEEGGVEGDAWVGGMRSGRRRYGRHGEETSPTLSYDISWSLVHDGGAVSHEIAR